MKLRKLAPVGALLLLTLALTGCNKLRARDELNKGVAAYKSSQFQPAIDHFQKAVEYDDTLLAAKLYLATAYGQIFVPGGQSEDNIKAGKTAIEKFQDVLRVDPNNAAAIGSIAAIYYNLQDFDKAKEYQRKRMQLTPNDPEPHYWVGVIDWGICYKNDMQVRKDLNLAMPDKNGDLPPLPDRDRKQLADDNSTLISEGIQELQKAIDLKPNDENSMSYLSLMYRQKLDIDDTNDERDADTKTADELHQKAMGIMKANSAKASGTG
jgi:tetratricopeptide (TPR) repeat protein